MSIRKTSKADTQEVPVDLEISGVILDEIMPAVEVPTAKVPTAKVPAIDSEDLTTPEATAESLSMPMQESAFSALSIGTTAPATVSKDIVIIPGYLGAGVYSPSQIDFKLKQTSTSVNDTTEVKATLYNYGERIAAVDYPVIAIGGVWNGLLYAPTDATATTYGGTTGINGATPTAAPSIIFHPATGTIDATTFNGSFTGALGGVTTTADSDGWHATGGSVTARTATFTATDFTVNATNTSNTSGNKLTITVPGTTGSGTTYTLGITNSGTLALGGSVATFGGTFTTGSVFSTTGAFSTGGAFFTSSTFSVTGGGLTLTSGATNPTVTIPNLASSTALVTQSASVTNGVAYNSTAVNGQVAWTAAGTSGQALIAGAPPAFGALAIGSTTNVSGQLLIGNGGTGSNLSALVVNQFLVATSTTAFGNITITPTVVATNNSAYLAFGTISAGSLPLNISASNSASITSNSLAAYDSSGFLWSTNSPTQANHVVNKAYADALVSGLDVHDAVRYATVPGNVVFSSYNSGTGVLTTTANITTIDAHTLVTADINARFLLKDFTGSGVDKPYNGIYNLTSLTGTTQFTRATDANSQASNQEGTFAFVEFGSANAKQGYIQTNPITTFLTSASTSDINFTIFTGASSVTTGQGLQSGGGNIIGTIINQVLTTSTITFGGNGSTGSFSNTNPTFAVTSSATGTGTLTYNATGFMLNAGQSLAFVQVNSSITLVGGGFTLTLQAASSTLRAITADGSVSGAVTFTPSTGAASTLKAVTVDGSASGVLTLTPGAGAVSVLKAITVDGSVSGSVTFTPGVGAGSTITSNTVGGTISAGTTSSYFTWLNASVSNPIKIDGGTNTSDGFTVTGGNTTQRSLAVTAGNITITGGGNTLTLAGNLTTSGANAITFTTTGTTSLTLPTTGTLLTSTPVGNQSITGGTSVVGLQVKNGTGAVTGGTLLPDIIQFYRNASTFTPNSQGADAGVNSSGIFYGSGALLTNISSANISLTQYAVALGTGSSIQASNVQTTTTGMALVSTATYPAFGALNLANTGTVTGLLPLANGGTNNSLAATAGNVLYMSGTQVTQLANSVGGIMYSTATAPAWITTATTGQILLGTSAGPPTFSNIASIITAGTGITITGTTNATISVNQATNWAWTGNSTFAGTSGFTGNVTVSGGASVLVTSTNAVSLAVQDSSDSNNSRFKIDLTTGQQALVLGSNSITSPKSMPLAVTAIVAGTAITTAGTLVKFSLAGSTAESVTPTTTSDASEQIIGVAMQTGAIGASVYVARDGKAIVMADTVAVSVGDYLTVSTITAGYVQGGSQTKPSSGYAGRAMSAKAAGSAGQVTIFIDIHQATSTGNITGSGTQYKHAMFTVTGSPSAIGDSAISQNSGGTLVAVNGVAANGQITIGTNTSTSAGGLYFGTDTFIFRSNTNALTISGGTTIATGGLTVTSGGLTVSAGGASITGVTGITGATSITGNTSVTGTFTVSGANATALGGTLTVTGATQLNSTLTVAASQLSTLNGGLVIGGLSVASSGAITFVPTSAGISAFVATNNASDDSTTNVKFQLKASNGTSSVFSVDASGTLRATAKSFDIPHPTKAGKRLVYGVLEGPEHGVYHRGVVEGKGKIRIELPEYWSKLASDDYTINLTDWNGNSIKIVDKDASGFSIVRKGFFGRWLKMKVEFYVVGSRLDVTLVTEEDES